MKTRGIVDVFLASPGDLRSERAAISKVVEELNNTWSEYVGINLQLLRWETHTWPGIGHGAQDVVNRRIGDDYNILIALIGERLGSPTRKAASGTVEELERALERAKSQPENVEVMVYFKEVSSPSSEVVHFRKRASELGIYYWLFRSRQELQEAVRIHLSRQMQTFARQDLNRPKSLRTFKQVTRVEENNIAQTVEGLTGEIEHSTIQLNDKTDLFVRCIDAFTLNIDALTKGLNHYSRPGFRKTPGGPVALLEKFSGQMKEYSGELKRSGAEVVEVYRHGLEAMSDLVTTVAPLAPTSPPITQLLNNAWAASSQITGALLRSRASYTELRESIAGMSTLAGVQTFLPAKHSLLKTLDFLDDEFTACAKFSRELSQTIEVILG